MSTSIYPTSKKNIRKTTAQFIAAATAVHGDRYDYSLVNYKNSKTPVDIICAIHGAFPQIPKVHYNGSGCNDCGIEATAEKRRLSIDTFISRAIEAHGDRYDYSLVKYKNNIIPVDIICPVHGSFPQGPYNHTKGHGCLKCSHEKSTWTVRQDMDKAEDTCVLYEVKISGNGETFYKTGISNTVDKRHRKITSQSGYAVEIIRLITDTRYTCEKLEKKILTKRQMRGKYTPLLKFSGYTECYQ